MPDGPEIIHLLRAFPDEVVTIKISRDAKRQIIDTYDALTAALETERARVKALMAAGDALDAALGVYVATPIERKLLAWRPVAGRRAAWRAARGEGA